MFVFSFVGQLTINSSGMSSSIWILDSGVSHHMSLDSFFFFAYMSFSSSILVMTADGTLMPLVGVGSVVTPNLPLPLMFIIFRNSH